MTALSFEPKEIDPSARMQLIGMGDLMHPACCAVCGNGSCDLGYVDIGVWFEYEGSVYLCMLCATQVAETGGMYSMEQSQQLRDISNEALAENKILKDRLEKASERLGHYDALLNDSISSDLINDVSDDSVSNEELIETEPDLLSESDEVVVEPVNEGTGQEPELIKPVTVGKRNSNSVLSPRSDFKL